MALDSIRFRETKEKKHADEDLSQLSYEELYKSVYGIDGAWLKDHEHQESEDPFSWPIPDSNPEHENELNFDKLLSPPPLESSENEESVSPEDVAKAQADFNALLESMLGYGTNPDQDTSENEMGGRSR